MTTRILKYLNQEMSSEEKLQFEKELAANKELKRKLELHKDLDFFLQNETEFEELRQQVKEIHTNFSGNKKRNRSILSRTSIMGIAASLLIFIGITSFLMIRKTPSYLFSQNFEVWQPKNITRGADFDPSMLKWMGLYATQEYQQVVNSYNELPAGYLSEPTVMIIYSCSLMELNRLHDALNVLNRIDVSNSTLLAADIEWYKGLCYLKLKEFDNAKHSFEKLAESSKLYGKKAKIIAQRIRNR